MKIIKIYSCCIAALMMLGACNTRTPGNTNDPVEQLDVKVINVTEIENYFSNIAPIRPIGVVIVDENLFNNDFHPARTMNNEIPEIDFSTQNAAAIVLPETAYNTIIRLDSTYLWSNVLNVRYSVEHDSVRRSFTTLPVKLFTFDNNLDISTVLFINNTDTMRVDI